MRSFAALCDDLTGSSVQSILLKDRGLSVRQIIRPSGELPVPEDGEALVINCDTRRRSPAEAKEIFRRFAALLPPSTGIGKRIDTTLRGHLCDETAELLSARPGALALVVPAYPASGRTTVGGYHLLGGSLLERTEVARDPMWPVSSSYVPGYFSGRFSCGLIAMETVKLGPEAVAEALSALVSDRVSVAAADAMTAEDIEILAEGAVSVAAEIIPVDPGPFTAAFLGRKLPGRNAGTVLAIIGSTSEKTARQIAWTEGKLRCARFTLLPGERTADALPRLRAFLADLPDNADFLLIRPSPEIVRGSENTTAAVLADLGREAFRLLGRKICGILLSGGDTAAMFFEGSGAASLAPGEEIQPLMMGGRILDGEFAGLSAVTKGGLIGEEDGVYRAVQWLKKERT
ncbi:four-carbon acid sugar kinase family protein [Aminivibrio sp.]|jgi:uncharacterized protein YgbK (DUF1537 family)|uniref:four-carbon acid sugar kinase family protein n=1 Tax=Aminivibrio sp. TaxID=1872489 RepID=UPI001A60FD9C|nr:four-carbon acid sugar kinase family protein [Aminivibrio sp.]MBL3539912.1 hypothetical protein [Aminivibrio sp.]MDK2959461.1 D-threonate/D-erythronate kinase [Synergistaceae bacterium]